MDMSEVRRAYEAQPIFRQVVDMMVAALMRGDFSVYELRDACTYAMDLYAVYRPPEPVYVRTSMTIDEVNEHIVRGLPITGEMKAEEAENET